MEVYVFSYEKLRPYIPAIDVGEGGHFSLNTEGELICTNKDYADDVVDWYDVSYEVRTL